MPDEIPPSKVAKEIPPVSGAIPVAFSKLFGPSYRTTLSGYAAGLGGILLAVAPFLTGKSAQIAAVVGAILTGGGVQQLGIHSKDKAVTGVEPK